MHHSKLTIVMRMSIALAIPCAAQRADAGGGQWTLIGWNNLGMHCMDDDYSVFTILPPYNTVDAQLINAQGKLVIVSSRVDLTYEAVADLDGSINRTSVGKSNFWDFALASYGAGVPADSGLGGTAMPGLANIPQSLTWASGFNWFEGLGIPITPIDDAGRANSYPLMRLIAKSNAGTVLAQTDVVLPVSGEMDCRVCHGSGAGPAARPAGGWVSDPDAKRDYRLNILRLHDEQHLGSAYVSGRARGEWLPRGRHVQYGHPREHADLVREVSRLRGSRYCRRVGCRFAHPFDAREACDGYQPLEWHRHGQQHEPQRVLPMPSWFDHALSARRDGCRGRTGRFARHAMPKLPRHHEPGRFTAAHGVAR